MSDKRIQLKNTKSRNIIIEEIKMENIRDNELSEFVSTEPIQDSTAIPNQQTQEPMSQEQEGLLIQRFIDGQLSFTDYNNEIGHIVDDEIDEHDDGEEVSETEKLDQPSTSRSIQNQIQTTPTKAGKSIRPLPRDSKVQKRVRSLPPALQGLMGEANLCYVRGQLELAEKICLEIIRQEPLAHEPFLTLAQIHESNPEKHSQFLLLAAHLNPGDVDQWDRLAQLSMEQGNTRQAINCYSKGIKHDPCNLIFRMRKIELLQSINEEKLAMRNYVRIVPLIPSDQGEFLLETAKMVTEYLVRENQIGKALLTLNCAYSKVPDLFKFEDINIYLDVLILNESYQKVLEILSHHTNLQYTLNEDPVDGEGVIHSYHIPDEFILDFRSKAFVSLVSLGALHLIDNMLADIFTNFDIEEAGDCYLDIAEALMKQNRHEDALKLLAPLVSSTNFNLAAVWLHHANCHRAIGNIEEAIESYKRVISMAPQHFDVRLILSNLLKQQGRDQEALAALEQNAENELLDPSILYERCVMLKESGNLDQYVDVAFLLLSRHCLKIKNRDELHIAASIQKVSNIVSLIKQHRINRYGTDVQDGPEFVTLNNRREPTVEMEWTLLEDILQITCQQKRFDLMQHIVITISTSRRFSAYQKHIDFWSMLSVFYNRDPVLTYTMVKDYVNRYSNYPRVWNFFNAVIQFTDNIRYAKFLLRYFRRTQFNDIYPSLIRANYFLSAGTYKYALNDYIVIYKKTGSTLATLLIAITYSQLAQQKFMKKKQSLVAQALAFAAEYKSKRELEAPHEVNYNLGRLYYQCGINHLAVYHFNQVLSIKMDLIKMHENYLDLSKEAAFNLHLIYKNSGNIELARKILFEYIVI